ncbi:MAG: M67 family metallopeptidase [Oscillatoriaceae cyanobacterium Prado104]|jgi:proteasome lid subunit RPN8/RPN11|nr:M67 family metallopeptidase [Oscillatoriaceae cyanobacterium Prado104]
MQSIALSNSHISSIRTHAESTYPCECCGLLLGRVAGDVKTLVEVLPVQNAWVSEAEECWPEQKQLTETRRYAISPTDMLKAMKYGRDRSWEIIGIYHSHNDCPAVPSEFDRAGAWPQYSYIIVSVIQGSSTDLYSWILDGEGNFRSEEILTVAQT